MEMNELDRKYRNNTLSREELGLLRGKINHMSDGQMEQLLLDAWEKQDADDSLVDAARLEAMEKRIGKRLFPATRHRLVYKRILQIAAAVLLPVFIVATFYLYHENTVLSQKEVVICTAKGERTTVNLPDATRVTLNGESRLAYLLSAYNAEMRNVTFEGEGYFEVVKNSAAPFRISANEMQVSVLGTVFNFRTRVSESEAVLSLEEGSVELLSTKSNRRVILKPNQYAVLDRESGDIQVKESKHVTDASAWQRKELVFREATFSEVLDALSDVYNINIVLDGDANAFHEDSFTGVVSSTDLNEALEVIGRSYHLKAILKDGKIHLAD